MKVAIKRNAFTELTTTANVIGYNPYTKKFLICDENGNLISYNSIHRPTGKELTKTEYKRLEKEIKKESFRQLEKINFNNR